MNVRLFNNYVLVELEPERPARSGILIAGPAPVRIARVLAVGPGRRDKKGRLIRMQLQVGDRFPFFKAAADTVQGRALAQRLPEDQRIVRENDVLFVLEPGYTPEVTV
jgi:co-chaperonin GroES (HSP10)